MVEQGDITETPTLRLTEHRCDFVKIGDIIDERYKIIGFIGAGGVSCVYLAEHIYTKRKVALKILRPEIRKLYPSAEKHFREEARKIPEDPNVIEVYDAGVDEGKDLIYIAMEYCPQTLRKLLLKGAPKERLVMILIEVARAIARLHAQGIVHLDLKPENILIDEKGVPKICDFGFAKFKAETYSRSSAIWDTPVYTAPEVWSGEYSEKSDVYSLGVILAEILTGKPYSRDIEDYRLRRLVEEATYTDPDERPSAERFVKQLEPLIYVAWLTIRGPFREAYIGSEYLGLGPDLTSEVKPGTHVVRIKVREGCWLTKKVSLKPFEKKVIELGEKEVGDVDLFNKYIGTGTALGLILAETSPILLAYILTKSISAVTATEINPNMLFSILVSVIVYSLVILLLCVVVAGAIGMKKAGLKVSKLGFITGSIGAAIIGSIVGYITAFIGGILGLIVGGIIGVASGSWSSEQLFTVALVFAVIAQCVGAYKAAPLGWELGESFGSSLASKFSK